MLTVRVSELPEKETLEETDRIVGYNTESGGTSLMMGVTFIALQTACETAADGASASAESAKESSTSAANSASAAATSQTKAAASETAAGESATSAASSALEAAESAAAAAESEAAALTSAREAANHVAELQAMQDTLTELLARVSALEKAVAYANIAV